MKIPVDASLDVQAFAREVESEINNLKGRYVTLDGSRLIGAGDASTATGLVTLSQLAGAESRINATIASVVDSILALKARNGLV